MNKKYQIIYADPPWRYKDKSTSHGGGAESHYPTMDIKDICSLDVGALAEKDAVLLLWATMPLLPEALEVVKAWGFKYKTCAFTWVKTNQDGSVYMGMGRHTRANAEICLLATRGKGVKRISANVRNTHLFRRMRHSKKPDRFRQLIDELYGAEASKIELFARNDGNRDLFGKNPLDGWDVFGNEAAKSIEIA